jgi:uncharacterized membrane protein (UPF0127 family)
VHVFSVELATNDAERARGLMFRKELPEGTGMLFRFDRDELVSMWMKNTVIPLDMIFIRGDGTISSIAPNATPQSETPIPSYEPVRAVLEINGGRAAQLGIIPGEHVHNAIFGNVAAEKK